MEGLKETTEKLMQQLKQQNADELKNFKEEVEKDMTLVLKQQRENIELETKNKLQQDHKDLLEKIEIISEDKDIKLKELIASTTNNSISDLEKKLIKEIASIKEGLTKSLAEKDKAISSLKTDVRSVRREVKELKIDKYSRENKMGAILIPARLLGEDIENKEDWRIPDDLKILLKEIEGTALEPSHISFIEERLSKIENDPRYKLLVEQIRKKYTKDGEQSNK